MSNLILPQDLYSVIIGFVDDGHALISLRLVCRAMLEKVRLINSLTIDKRISSRFFSILPYLTEFKGPLRYPRTYIPETLTNGEIDVSPHEFHFSIGKKTDFNYQSFIDSYVRYAKYCPSLSHLRMTCGDKIIEFYQRDPFASCQSLTLNFVINISILTKLDLDGFDEPSVFRFKVGTKLFMSQIINKYGGSNYLVLDLSLYTDRHIDTNPICLGLKYTNIRGRLDGMILPPNVSYED